jgi:ribosome-binding protein aMBF1 (putative translation factor)
MAINKFEQLRETVGEFKKSETLDRFEFDLAHKDSLRKSQLIALKILRTLRSEGISQKNLAKEMQVSPQQVSKWVKGSENFTLETIDKLEHVLKIKLVEVATEKGGSKKTPTVVVTNTATYQVSLSKLPSAFQRTSAKMQKRGRYARPSKSSLQYA